MADAAAATLKKALLSGAMLRSFRGFEAVGPGRRCDDCAARNETGMTDFRRRLAGRSGRNYRLIGSASRVFQARGSAWARN